MKTEIEELITKMKSELADCAKNPDSIEDSIEIITDILSDIEDEISSLEEDIENEKYDLRQSTEFSDNSIIALLNVCKEVYETNVFSDTNVTIVNKIAMKTDNDSRLLWEHNKKI